VSGPLADWRWPLDERLFEAINGYEHPALDAVWVAASTRVFGVLCSVGMALWLLTRFRKQALWPLVQVGVTIAVSDGLCARVVKPWFARLRPSFSLAPDLVRVLAPAGNTSSMPSIHAANSFAVAAVITVLMPRAGWVAYPFAVLISVSRVGVGVHWPSDVVAGALIGTALGLGVALCFRRALRQRPGLT